MTGTVYTCLHTNQARSYLNHLVYEFRRAYGKHFREVLYVRKFLTLSNVSVRFRLKPCLGLRFM